MAVCAYSKTPIKIFVLQIQAFNYIVHFSELVDRKNRIMRSLPNTFYVWLAKGIEPPDNLIVRPNAISTWPCAPVTMVVSIALDLSQYVLDIASLVI